MKDIKELIYAAVEENALKFQELVNAQLQVRAYDAIEALRPEIGASMFGEAKKMKDDEEEMEDEDEDEEMEDEDEMDDKKKSMKEATHPKSKKEKDLAALADPKDKITHKDVLVGRGVVKTEEVESIDEAVFDSKDAAQSVANKLKAKHDDGNYHVKADNGKHRVVHAYYPNSKVKKEIANLTEEVEQIDEASYNKDSEHHKNARKAAKSMGGKAKYHPNGHASVSFQDVVHGRSTVNPKGTVLSTGEENAKRAAKSHGGKAVGNVVHFKEEVEQVNERSREDLISQIKGLKKPAIKHGFDWPSNDSTDKTSTKDLKSFHKSARSLIKQGLKAKAKAKADVQEVAMPKNAADWQAMINHQIQIAGHPVATDAQFRATTVGKDMSKIASLEPGQDALQYATAQGGTVKLP